MLRPLACLVLLGCAHETVETDPPACCLVAAETAATATPPQRFDGPERCEAEARAKLTASRDEAWRALWRCVAGGRFTALRELLDDAWDHELRTRVDGGVLLARVIAERGGDVERDLRLVHERRLPVFSLAQVLARPELRGALVIVRARVSARGLLDETRLAGQTWQPRWRELNVDVATGARVLAAADGDPFLDADEPEVLLGRFDGARDDGWPTVTVLAHFRPSATTSY